MCSLIAIWLHWKQTEKNHQIFTEKYKRAFHCNHAIGQKLCHFSMRSLDETLSPLLIEREIHRHGRQETQWCNRGVWAVEEETCMGQRSLYGGIYCGNVRTTELQHFISTNLLLYCLHANKDKVIYLVSFLAYWTLKSL